MGSSVDPTLDCRLGIRLGRALLLLALTLGSAPEARADSALLESASVGAAVEAPPGKPADARFLIGLGLDWIHDSGLTAGARLSALHTLETTLALTAGWAGPGLLDDRGLALGLGAGPAGRLDLNGRAAVGGRGVLAIGLWYARATLELDATLLREPNGPPGLELIVGLSLRVVPWSPQRL